MGYFKKLEKQLDQLQCIVDSLEKLRSQIFFEEKVFSAELHDRSVKGLHGDEAIEHFNFYMRLFGLDRYVIDLTNRDE